MIHVFVRIMLYYKEVGCLWAMISVKPCKGKGVIGPALTATLAFVPAFPIEMSLIQCNNNVLIELHLSSQPR